jgi:hypothetical protein
MPVPPTLLLSGTYLVSNLRADPYNLFNDEERNAWLAERGFRSASHKSHRLIMHHAASTA